MPLLCQMDVYSFHLGCTVSRVQEHFGQLSKFSPFLNAIHSPSRRKNVASILAVRKAGIWGLTKKRKNKVNIKKK